jgi:hypothetical protein
MKPARAALPVTETGYRSHFIDAKSVINAGASSASRLFLNIWPPLSKHGSKMPVPKSAGTNAKHAKPQATNSRSFRAGAPFLASKLDAIAIFRSFISKRF